MRVQWVAATVLAFLPVHASAAPFTNGDFETGLTGWTVEAGRVEALPGSLYAIFVATGATPAQAANTYVFFGGDNVVQTNRLTQSFSTLIGRTYQFAFQSGNVGGSGSQVINYNFGGQTGNTAFFFGNNFNNSQIYTGSFVATSSVSTISFSNSSFVDNTDVWVDNVSISSVPEASTWAMLIAGFGLVGAASRRQRAALNTAAKG